MDAFARAHLQPPAFLRLLAHDLRWRIVTALSRSDYRGLELVRLLGQPQNLVSYHLKLLREEHVVNERRSSADARDIYYSVDLAHLREIFLSTGDALHPALNRASTLQTQEYYAVDNLPPTRVLFACTHNSGRSQMAEAIMHRIGGSMVRAYSAGTEPTQIHPYAVDALSSMGIEADSARSKHIDVYAGEIFDYIITVCDRVRETCPVFPDDPEHIHWSFADPAEVMSDPGKRAAFAETAHALETRIRYLLTQIAAERGKSVKAGSH